jgi:hypothetical protein
MQFLHSKKMVLLVLLIFIYKVKNSHLIMGYIILQHHQLKDLYMIYSNYQVDRDQ